MPAAAPPFVRPSVHPGATPPPPKTLVVWSPAGEREEHSTLNARDLVRSCGYTYQSPLAAPSRSPTPEGGNYQSPPISGPAPNPALDALNAQRKRAEELGIEVDNRWGTRRLNELIAEAEAKPEASE